MINFGVNMKNKRLNEEMNEDESLSVNEVEPSKQIVDKQREKANLKHRIVVAMVTMFVVVTLVLSISLPLALKDDEHTPTDSDYTYGYSMSDYTLLPTTYAVASNALYSLRSINIGTTSYEMMKLNANLDLNVGVKCVSTGASQPTITVYVISRLHSFFYGKQLADKCDANMEWESLYVRYNVARVADSYQYTITFADIAVDYYIEFSSSSLMNVYELLDLLFG